MPGNDIVNELLDILHADCQLAALVWDFYFPNTRALVGCSRSRGLTFSATNRFIRLIHE